MNNKKIFILLGAVVMAGAAYNMHSWWGNRWGGTGVGVGVGPLNVGVSTYDYDGPYYRRHYRDDDYGPAVVNTVGNMFGGIMAAKAASEDRRAAEQHAQNLAEERSLLRKRRRQLKKERRILREQKAAEEKMRLTTQLNENESSNTDEE